MPQVDAFETAGGKTAAHIGSVAVDELCDEPLQNQVASGAGRKLIGRMEDSIIHRVYFHTTAS